MLCEIVLLPDFPPSARRQQAEGFLWFHTGRRQCGLEPQFGPLGGWQTGAQLKSKGQKTPVLVDQWRPTHQDWRLSGLWGDFKQKKTSTITTWPNQNGSAVQSFHAALYISVFRSLNGSEQRKDTNDYHDCRCHGNQVGHSSRWGWGWMNDSHICIHKGEGALVTMAFISETTQRHTHALETSKTMNRYTDTEGLIMSDFPYVRFSLHLI